MSDEKQTEYYPFVPPSMYFTWQRVPLVLVELEWSRPEKAWCITIEANFQDGGLWYARLFRMRVPGRKMPPFMYSESGLTMKCMEKFYRLAQAQFFKSNPDDLPPIIP